MTSRIRKFSPAQAWARALELTTPIAQHPEQIFPGVIGRHAAEHGNAPALLSEHECFTYGELAGRANQYSRWALANGIRKGDCVGVLMPNRPELFASWLGITQAGGIAALLNTNLMGASLDYCMNLVAPKRLVREPLDLREYSLDPLSDAEKPNVTIADRALYIYTSGTTGLPKAASISHGRIMQWTHWFAGMMNAQPTDRMYNCLPMYHSVGGVQAPGAVLAGGGSVVISEKFSARRFWRDVVRWECTLVQYIGELCRYLLNTESSTEELQHRIRMACGNGLRPDIWQAFQDRFRIPQILEFYAATEGNVSLFNLETEPGAIGRIPSYLAHRFPATLIRLDSQGAPIRGENGFCVRCGPNHIGEAIGRISSDSSNVGARFEGYTSAAESEKKVLRNVFEPGDSWFRTGDLMRTDERGFFYFVDRIGDTFRWKGENVSTSEVADTLCQFSGIKEAIVYGIAIPGTDGRAGMATVVAEHGLDLRALTTHLSQRLPHYARPLFLRIRPELDLTSTFKYTKTDLIRQGYDPSATSDPIFFNDPDRGTFVPLDEALLRHIQTGEIWRTRRNQHVEAQYA